MAAFIPNLSSALSRRFRNRGAAIVNQRLRRRNTRILVAYAGFVSAVVFLEALLFRALMWWGEGRQESLATGIYWVLSTMSTLGVGDIVFTGTAGRLYTVFVLLTGIILLLAVLPFAFVRFFYAPWLASRTVPSNISGHIVIAGHGDLARPLVETLELHRLPHFMVEPDTQRATHLEEEGVPVISRPLDEQHTYQSLRIDEAALVVLDGTDAENTNSALQIHDLAPNIHIAAVASSEQAEDILRLAGVRRVLPLKRLLGQHLAARLNAGHAQTHVIGRLRDLLVAEMPVHMTPWVGQSIRDLDLRDRFGVNVVGVLEQAQFRPAHSETVLGPQSVPVVIGTAAQMRELDEFLIIYNVNYSPVVVVGGGVVGHAATRVLRKRGVPVHVVDLKPQSGHWGEDQPERWIVGDASDRRVLVEAGLLEAPSVLLTTADDATNIYLALQCSHVAEDVRIVSRVTHERNLRAVQRAGAQVALSHTSLGVSSVFAALNQQELVILGEGVELHEFRVPDSLVGKTLEQSEIATRVGLNVIAIQKPDGQIGIPVASTVLEADDGLLMIGAQSQLQKFIEEYS
jgi:Trk K+ transport system NAD-binding subunit